MFAGVGWGGVGLEYFKLKKERKCAQRDIPFLPDFAKKYSDAGFRGFT